MKQKVSIITPVYNSEKFIAKTIESVVNQTYSNWELILVDDASTDASVEIIKQFQDKHANIILFQQETNNGAAIARNQATKLAKGEFIAFLDSDDLWKPHKLKQQINFMNHNKIDVCFSSYDLIDEKGSKLYKRINALPVLNYKRLLKSNYIGNLTGIYNAKTLGKISVLNLKKRQDWLLWLEALKRTNKPVKSLSEPLAYYRVRDNSISSNKFNLLKYNYWVYKKGLGFSTLKSTIKMVFFLKEHFFIKPKYTSIIKEI